MSMFDYDCPEYRDYIQGLRRLQMKYGQRITPFLSAKINNHYSGHLDHVRSVGDLSLFAKALTHIEAMIVEHINTPNAL